MKKSVRLHLFLPPAIAATVLLCTGVQSRADYASTVSSFNPLGYWRFDETAASPALNTVSNSGTLGSLGTGYVVQNVDKGQPGIVGNCIRLNNPGNVVGSCLAKVDVPWNAGFNPHAPFTIEFWAKPNSIGTDSTGFSPVSNFDPNWYPAGRSGWLFYVDLNGRWQFRLGNTGGYAAICSGTSGNATPGVWQHIVATYDGSNVKLYANGVQIGSAAQTAPWFPNNQSFIRIGGTPLTGTGAVSPYISASGNNGNRGWDGWVDEFAIYPTLLTPAKIAAHYSAASTNNAGYSAQILIDNPAGYWGLNEPAVVPPSPSTFPAAANSGSLGSAADGTNEWGTLAAQAGSGFAGLGAGNKAAFFDGDNGYFQINDAPGLHFTGAITMMAWIKPTEQDYFRNIIGHGFDDNFAETFLRISRGGGVDGYGTGNYYEVGTSDGLNFYDSAVVPIPPGDIGNWVFLAGTFDGSSWNIYRNGVLAASIPSANGAVDVTNRWTIGSFSDPQPGQGQYFGGSIDEPAIFGTALSEGNINAIYNAAQVSPTITAGLQNPGTVFKGSSASFSVWAEGSPSLSYSWTSNGVSLGVTATNLTLNNFAVGNPTIAVVINNPYGSATSSVTFPVVAAAPAFTTQPAPATRYIGRPFSFSVAVSGSTPLSLQWKTNGVVIPGATSTSYSGIAAANNAFTYTCTASNEAGVVTSSGAPLTVLPIPSNFPGAVIADSPVAYWRLGESSGTVAHDYYGGFDGTYLSATLGQPGYSAVDPDTATVFGGVNSYVGNISGTGINFTGHTNFSIEVWVNGAAGQPDESTIIAKGIGPTGTTRTEQFSLDVAGGNYRFFTSSSTAPIVETDGTSGPDGTWQHVVAVYDDSNGAMRLYVNGALQSSGGIRAAGLVNTVTPISIGSKRTGNDPNYDGTFTGTIDEVAIYPYALSASQVQAHYAAAYGSSLAPAISKQPVGVTNYVTLDAHFSVGAYGTVPLSYQWKKGGVPLSDGGNITGSGTEALTIFPLTSTDAGNYSVSIGNVNGSTNSVSVPLAVLAAPSSPPSIPGLVMHHTFDNTLVDATGRGNNGTSLHVTTNFVSGGGSTNTVSPTYNPGMLGQALHYSTDAAVNAGVGYGTNTFFVSLGVRPDLLFGTDVSFTVAYWIKLPANYTGGDLPIFTDTAGSTFGQGYVFAPSYGSDATVAPGSATAVNGAWAMSFFDSAGAGVGVYGVLGSINDGNWHHLVHVVDRTLGMTTYLDGIRANSAKQAGTTAAAATASVDATPPHPATIGQDPTGMYGENGSGDIDDLGVWRRALTQLEAAALYTGAAVNGVSFSGSFNPVTLTIIPVSGNNVQITWSYGILQSATTVNGTYTDVVGATSPFTTSTAGGAKYFRVKQ